MAMTEKDLIDEICCKLGFMPSDDKKNDLAKVLFTIEAQMREMENSKTFIKGVANNCLSFLEINN